MSHPLAVFVLSLAAGAQNPWLESARSAYARLECDRVLADLEQARQVPTNDLPTQLAILDYAGRCHVALGNRAEADAAFTQMLALDPQAEVDPSLSPKIRDAFRAAKLRLFPAGYFALKELPASEGLVRAELLDPWRRAASVVLGRWSSRTERFEEEPLRPEGGVYLVRLAAGEAWFLEARGPAGEPLALLGQKTAPVPAPPVAAGPPPASLPLVLTPPVAVDPPQSPPPLVVHEPPPPEKSTARKVVKWSALAAGTAAVVTGLALWVQCGKTRGQAERAAWADDATALDGRASAEGNWATVLFLGGLGVGVAGTVLAW